MQTAHLTLLGVVFTLMLSFGFGVGTAAAVAWGPGWGVLAGIVAALAALGLVVLAREWRRLRNRLIRFATSLVHRPIRARETPG